MPAAGSKQMAVEAGKTYVAELRQRAGGRMLASVTVPAQADCKTPTQSPRITPTKPPTITPTPARGCPGRCFDRWEVEAHGTYAIVKIRTTGPVRVEVRVSTTPPTNGMLTSYTSWSGAGSGETHEIPVLNLQSGVLHHFELLARDGYNQLQSETPNDTFTTLRRRLTVHYDKLYIINDSDGGSEGDLSFAFCVNPPSTRTSRCRRTGGRRSTPGKGNSIRGSTGTRRSARRCRSSRSSDRTRPAI